MFIRTFLPTTTVASASASASATVSAAVLAVSETTNEVPMVNTREMAIIGLLFVAVIIFQFYVYLKIDESAESYEDLDAKRKEEERKRRNDMLMKALSAF